MDTHTPFSRDHASDALVERKLASFGKLTTDALRGYLPAGGHHDYLGALVADYPTRGGKMLRPALCLATACAFGAQAEDALGCAVAIELIHNALLIHDDIEDDSEQRRGRPTLHALHGVPLALNAGDALGMLSMRPLRDNARRLGPFTANRIVEETELMAWETAGGQAMELGWRRDNRLDLEDSDYLTMVLKKTCWLTTIYPMRVGCMIGGGTQRQMEAIFRLGFFFGAAFQIQDDLLNLEGDVAYGKEICGDLLEGKRTLMLLHGLRHAKPAERRRLLRFLETPRARRKPADVAWIRALLVDTGAMAHSRATAELLTGAARYEFEQAFGGVADSEDKQFLHALIAWVLRRIH